MAEPLEVDAGTLDADTVLAALHEGRHVVVRTEFLGAEHEVTLRYDGDTYYCDTPTRLHRHATAEEMRTCLAKQGYATE